jgi:ABC-type uncharacterized transport system ATPase subunit
VLYLQMLGITKTFPGVVANDGVDLSVEQGKIHALVGENGAGKTTLMKVLYGMEAPDAGRILLRGQEVSIPNPQTAIGLGIGMVHQHFQLVPSLTVAQNIALGHEPKRGPFVDRTCMVEKVRTLSNHFGLQVNPTATVADLSVGVQQRVEILKLLYRQADLLILDEPTAVLTPQEVHDLFEVLGRLADEGRTIIFITHKLEEVMTICDHATVLRRGRVAGVLNIAETSKAEIARLMVGREIEAVRRQPGKMVGEAMLAVCGLQARDDRGLPAVCGITFEVHAGELVGLAGVEGNGQRELLEALSGLRPLDSGSITLRGNPITYVSSRARRERGLSIIPEDRTHEGLSLPSTITENLLSTRYYHFPFSRWGVLAPHRMAETARELIRRFDIRAESENTLVSTLSGGNTQKVVVARELAERPTVLVAAHPTRGLDVAAAHFVHQELLRLRSEGVGILLVSADLEEIMALSDRILVIFEGQIVGELGPEESTQERLGLLMAGQRDQR